MKKILKLTKIQMMGIFNVKKMFHMNTNKKSSPIVLGFLVLFFLIIFSGSSAAYAAMYASFLKPMGALEVIPIMYMALTSVVMLFTTIYKVKGTLFSFSDYDMIMSLPVSTSGIIASRIFVLYIYNLMFALVILLPGNIVYGIYANASVIFYLISTLLVLFVPIIPILIGTLLGLIVNVASSKFRYSNIVTLVLSIGMFVAVMVLNMQASFSENQEEVFVDIAQGISNRMYEIHPLSKLYGEGVIEFNLVSILGFIGISILIFFLYCFVIGKYFKKMNTAMSTLKARSNYKIKQLKTTSVVHALYKKEMKRFFASPNYVLNASVGTLLLTVVTVVLLFIGEEQISKVLGIPGFTESISDYITVVLFFCGCMTCTTAASISLEGKNLWILRSLPLTPMQIFTCKVMVNLTMTIPFLVFDAIVFGFVFKLNLLQALSAILLPCSGTIFISLLGLIINLRFPRFDWKSEMEIIKQGLPVTIALLVAMALSAFIILLIFVFPRVTPAYLFLAYAFILFIVSLGLYRYLIKEGSTRFEQL